MSPAAKGKTVLYVYISEGLMRRLDKYLSELQLDASRSSLVEAALNDFLMNDDA